MPRCKARVEIVREVYKWYMPRSISALQRGRWVLRCPLAEEVGFEPT